MLSIEELSVPDMPSPSEHRTQPSRSGSGRGPKHPNRRRRRAPSQIDFEIRRLERWERLKSWGPRLGLFAVVVALGALEFTVNGRHWLARLLTVGLPLVSVPFGMRHLQDAHPRLRAAGLALGASVVVLSEVILLAMLFGSPVSGAIALGAWFTMVLLALGAAGVEGLAARRGTDTRLAAFVAIAGAFALYLGTRGAVRDPFDASLGALVVALPVGGAVGVTLGLIARWLTGARL